jgi:hypothetical protein
MSPIEDLLRQTFADRAQDVTEPPPLPARHPEARQRWRGVTILAGAAAAAAVLVGSTVVYNAARSGGTAVSRPSPSAAALRFVPAPITSTGDRTSAVIGWAPTWTPVPPTGYEVTRDLQARFYGFQDGTFAAVAIGRGNCAALLAFKDEFRVNLQWDLAVDTGRQFGFVLCRPLPAGGSLGVVIAGTRGAQAAAEARRVADSVRTGRRDEIALPAGYQDGTGVYRLTVGAAWEARSSWAGNVENSDGSGFYIGPPQDEFRPNQTVGGRPAWVNDSDGPPSPTTIVLMLLSPRVWTSTIAPTHARAVAVAAGLQLGSVPDYPWLH